MHKLENIKDKWKINPQKPIRVVTFCLSITELHWQPLGHFNWFSWLSSAMREWGGRHIITDIT